MPLINPYQLRKAEKELMQCPLLGPIIETYRPCKLNPKSRDPFDALISAIISQQLSVKAAATINQRLRNIAGDPFQPDLLLNASSGALRECGLSGRKVEYVRGIAQAVEDKSLDFEQLANLTINEASTKLTALRGVGQWTAEMFLMFSIGHIDIYSEQDVGLQRAMKQLFGTKAKSPKAMSKLAERWMPYRTIACWYLWRSIE